MEGPASSHTPSGGLTARILPAIYLFLVCVVSGLLIGHATVTILYHAPALRWWDALAVPILVGGSLAFTAHRRALEEHTEEEYLASLRKGRSPYIINAIALVSLLTGLATGGIFAVDNADRQIAEEETNEAIALGKFTLKFASRIKAREEAATTPLAVTNAVNTPEPTRSPLVLKSIVGSHNRRTALINNAVLGEGQSASIKADGRVFQVTCLKIHEEEVTLQIDGKTNVLALYQAP